MAFGLTITNWQKPMNADAFSSLSLMSHRTEHHVLPNWARWTATRSGKMRPSRPIVTAAFSSSDLGVDVLSRMRMRHSTIKGTCDSRWPRRAGEGLSARQARNRPHKRSDRATRLIQEEGQRTGSRLALHGDLSKSPSGVVAHADLLKLWRGDLVRDLLGDPGQVEREVVVERVAVDGHVSEHGVGRLSDWCLGVLRRYAQKDQVSYLRAWSDNVKEKENARRDSSGAAEWESAVDPGAFQPEPLTLTGSP